jgi:hypothetical protein
MAMIAMTTSNSIKVNAAELSVRLVGIIPFRAHTPLPDIYYITKQPSVNNFFVKKLVIHEPIVNDAAGARLRAF